MRRAVRALRPLLPALLLAVLTLWAGTFFAGAAFRGAVVAHATVLGACVLGGRAWRDPLALGRRGRWLPPLLVVVAGMSLALGPVPRAGLVGLLLLPAFLLLPAAFEACWRTREQLELGLVAVGAVFGAVAAVALGLWWEQGSPRAAMPLGHHNLLATWLVVVWPAALAGLGYHRTWRRFLPLAAALGLTALAGTGSFLAVGAVLVQGLAVAVLWRPARLWVLAAAVVLLAGPGLVHLALASWDPARQASSGVAETVAGGEGPVVIGGRPGAAVPDAIGRVSRMLAGSDSSTRARSTYYAAGWRGLGERPLLGWGPGSVPFTIARFTRPVAGVNPPGEIVGDLHSLPLQLAYELGVLGIGLAAALIVVLAARRVREVRAARDPVALQAALVGLLGGGVMLLGNAPLAVLAIPAALALVVGVSLAAAGRSVRGGRRAVAGVLAYVVPVAAVLAPFEHAHYLYQRSLSSESAAAASKEMRRAVALDPGFALYRARSTWLDAELGVQSVDTAEEALRAAEAGYRLAPLWLSAGVLGLDFGLPWAKAALERAVALDPLSPIAAFHLMRVDGSAPGVVDLGQRAVLGDSRLGAALWWDRNPGLRERVAESLPPGSRAAFFTRPGGQTALLVQSLDTRSATSFSLFAFRRSPWPADLAPVEVRIGD